MSHVTEATEMMTLADLPGTPKECLDMAYEMGKKLAGFRGVQEHFVDGNWSLEFTEEALLNFMFEMGNIDRTESFRDAIAKKLTFLPNVRLNFDDDAWKWEFTHTALIDLCLWVRKTSF